MAQEGKLEKPVYQLIALDMAEKIVAGRYQVGEKVHGRSTLASKYNVSPETVRRAMYLLKDMEILEMKQGSGIFIKNVEKAQAFVESRSDRPQQISPYLYRTADFTDYLIYEVNIV